MGDGTTTDRTAPVKVFDNVRDISAGSFSSLAVLNNGTLMGWGKNKEGQLGSENTNDLLWPVKVYEGVQKAVNADTFSVFILQNNELMLTGKVVP